MEKYRLVFAGQRCGDYGKLPLDEHVKLLVPLIKLSDKATNKILNGQKLALKSSMDLEQMQQQKASFAKLGLVTDHQLQLNGDILSAGLRERSAESDISDQARIDVSESESSTDTATTHKTKPKPIKTRFKNNAGEHEPVDLGLPVFVVDDALTPPTVFNRPNVSSIDADYGSLKDKKNEPEPISVHDYHFQINGLILIIIALITSLALQSYVVALFSAIGLPGFIAGVFGLAFVLISTVMLPRLFQPLLNSALLFDHGEIELFEQPRLLLGRKSFKWRSIETSGQFSIGMTRADSSAENFVYEWTPYYRLDENSSGVIEELPASWKTGALSERIQAAVQHLLPYFSAWLPQGGVSVSDWSTEPASAVCNPQGSVVALVYEQSQTAYQIVREDLQYEESLHAFCLAIHRRGLV